MRNKKREQLLIQVITLLDGARLGERKETVMNLVHCARRASRERDAFSAELQSVEALSQLRKARHSLRIHGAPTQDIVLIESAIELLLPIQIEARADSFATLMVLSLEWRFLISALGCTLALVVVDVPSWFIG